MHRFVPHTGEVEVEIEAGSPAGVFAEAVLALAELIGDEEGEPGMRRIAADAADRATLLAAWLEELVFLAETEGFVAQDVVELDVRERSLRGAVAGRSSTPRQLVKAVTYHDLAFEEREGSWFARLVLDV